MERKRQDQDAGGVRPRDRQRQAQAHRRRPRRHLPRQDHEVERRQDQVAQPRRESSLHEDRRGPSLRQLGHQLHLLELPGGRLRQLGEQGGRGSKSPTWPTGVGGKGNEGVAALVKQSKGRIGYVEYAYAKQARIPWTQLKNKSGKWILPSVQSFGAAAATATFPASSGFAGSMVNSGGTSWPITGATYILVKKSNRTTRPPTPCSSSSTGRTRTRPRRARPRRCSYVNIPSKTCYGGREHVACADQGRRQGRLVTSG